MGWVVLDRKIGDVSLVLAKIEPRGVSSSCFAMTMTRETNVRHAQHICNIRQAPRTSEHSSSRADVLPLIDSKRFKKINSAVECGTRSKFSR